MMGHIIMDLCGKDIELYLGLEIIGMGLCIMGSGGIIVGMAGACMRIGRLGSGMQGCGGRIRDMGLARKLRLLLRMRVNLLMIKNKDLGQLNKMGSGSTSHGKMIRRMVKVKDLIQWEKLRYIT
jgi:hypothetical protein